MEQEAADELVGGDGHDLPPLGTAAAIILVAERDPIGLESDPIGLESDQPTVEDRYRTNVAQ